MVASLACRVDLAVTPELSTGPERAVDEDGEDLKFVHGPGRRGG